MPRHDYTCSRCYLVQERFVPYESLDKVAVHCECGADMERQFAATTANYQRGEFSAVFMPFESYYDEALDCDIHGRREKKQILTAMGLQEAGDSVGGARNVETHPDAVVMDRQKARGRTFSDIQRERARHEATETFTDVSVEKSDGTSEKVDVKNLPTL